jgi:hypothetical protein
MWISGDLNPSGEYVLDLFDTNEFIMSAPQRLTHYSPEENGHVLETVVQQVIRLSGVIVYDILN